MAKKKSGLALMGAIPFGISKLLESQKNQQNKANARADDINQQNLARSQAEAERLRQATALSPEEQSLRSSLIPLLSQRAQQPAETLYTGIGPLSQQYYNTIMANLQHPGQLYTDTTALETQKALEEGLYPMLAQRGINPQSPLAIEEGRREARDVAIQNAQNRLAQINMDISRGGQLSQYAGGLGSEARQQALSPLENALQRQAYGAGGAASIGAGAINRYQSLEEAMLQNQIGQSQAAMGGFGQLAGMGIGAAAGSFAGPQGAMMGAQFGGQLGGSLGGGQHTPFSLNAYQGQGAGGWNPQARAASYGSGGEGTVNRDLIEEALRRRLYGGG